MTTRNRRASRIKRITGNLLPAAGLEGKFGPPQTLRKRMAYYHTPGVSLAVINDFKVEWAKGFGVADARHGNPVSPTTLFQVGSISKAIFALAVMRLVQEGQLSLDEDIHHYLFHTYPEMAAAGLWTTAGDLAQVGVELLGVLNERATHVLLNKATIESMLLPQLDYQKVGDGQYVGLGFFCDGKDDSFHFGHSGGNEGFVALMRFYRNIGKGAVIIINSNEGYPLLDEIMRAIAMEYKWPDALPKRKTAVRLANIQDYVGLYSTHTGAQFQVSSMGDHLMLRFSQQPPLPIFPSAELEFFARAINADIRFERDEQGGVATLTINQEGRQTRAGRTATA